MKSSIVRAGLAALVLACAAPAMAETLTNSEVIALVNAGLGEQAVVAKIETSQSAFQTDTQSLLALKDAGVPSTVIAAMLKGSVAPVALSDNSPDPLTPHYTGVYLFQDGSGDPQMVKIDPTASTQTKTGGIFGYALTGGLASASVKAVIPGDSARVDATSARPVFYMYFDEANSGQSASFSTGYGSAVQSPNEFSLIRMQQKKGRREARIGSMNIAGAKAGVMDKDQIPFKYDMIARGVYKVQPEGDLEPGEYGFIYAVGGGAGPGFAGNAGTAGARVFGFGVK